MANAAKIQTALRLSLQDQNSITLLKKEIDKAWKVGEDHDEDDDEDDDEEEDMLDERRWHELCTCHHMSGLLPCHAIPFHSIMSYDVIIHLM